ncbi:MAG TPA: nuclear transport factor 2 family protein [Thermoleophilaceae bacterium]
MIADGPVPGTRRGVDAMNEAWRNFVSAWRDFRIVPEEYFELDGGRVLNVGRFSARGKTSGRELDRTHTNGASLFHVRERRVTKLVVYWNGERALADLGVGRR